MARLRDILAALEEDDSDEAIIKLVLDTAAKRDPELPDLLRACAIPRVITAEIVGVLRGTPDDTAENKRLLGLVCAQSFVIRRPDHGFIFHDSTRDQLLADWQAPGDEARTARYTELNNALVDYYKARYDHSLESDALLAKVGDLIYQANPARLRRLTAAIEATMAASLQEATYHLLLTSPDRALSFFESYYFALEEASRVTIVTALISFIRDFAARHPEAANPALLLSLDYYDARIKEIFPGYNPEPLIKTFAGLADNTDAPARLRDWALASLSEVYAYKGDLSATLDTRFRLVERDFVIIDPHNEPLRYYALGDLYWQLADAERAIAYYQRCLARVTEVDEARADLGVMARLALASVYAELGDWPAAFGRAAEALVLARRELWYDLQVAGRVAVYFAQILGKLDARASDCAGTEAIALAAAAPQEVPGRLLSYIDVLLTAGRTRTVEPWLSRAEAERPSLRSPLIRFEVMDRRSMAAWIEQRREDCEALCSQLLAELPERPDTSYMKLAVLSRRGAQRDLLGDTEGAVSDYSLARAGFERLGYTTHAGVVAARSASVTARSGNVAAARDFLAAAEAGIPQYPTDQYAELVEAAGDVAEAAADFTGAQAHFEQFLGLAVARKDLVAQYMILGKLAALQERAGETELAAGYAKRETQARNQIAAHDVPATADQRQAQVENGAGFRYYCQAEDRSVGLELARQHFTQACGLDPENLWPALNLAFTCAGQEAWLESATALARAMELSPGPLRTAPALVDRLRDHVLLYLSDRFTRDDGWQAKAAAAARAVRRVAELLPPADLVPALTMQTVALVLSGDLTAGRTACREALSHAARGTAFTDAAAPLVVTIADYWALDDTLAAVEETAAQAVGQTGDTLERLRGKSAEAREALRERMDELIGLRHVEDPEEIPVPIPIVVEVGGGLVPIVDSKQDGGTFLFSLIPAMRDRIKAKTGVIVPGVRLRANDNLPPRGYNVQVDEIPVMTGVLPAGAVARQSASAPGPLAEPIDFDPRTGEPGVWTLRELAGDEPPDASDGEVNDGDAIIALSAPEYLINRIELAVRGHLARYLGPQEVAALVDEWAEQPAEPGTAAPREVVPDTEAVLHITWLLQRMVSDTVPIAEWRQILTVVRDAGGLTVPSSSLYQAVRRGLRTLLPGPGTGRTPVEVPSEYELPMNSANDGDTSTLPMMRRAGFLVWLGEQIAETGPAITLITQTQEGREAVAALARTQHRLVTALTREEADGNG